NLDCKFRAASRLILKGNIAAMLFNNSVDDRKAKSGSEAGWLGGEERVEDARGDLRRDARAVVRNLDPEPGFGGFSRAHLYAAASAAFENGLLGIDQQVQHDLLKLVWIGKS